MIPNVPARQRPPRQHQLRLLFAGPLRYCSYFFSQMDEISSILSLLGCAVGFCFLLMRNSDFKFGDQKWLVVAVLIVAIYLIPFMLLYSGKIKYICNDSSLLNVFLNYIFLVTPALIDHLDEFPGFHININNVKQHNSKMRTELFAACCFAFSSLYLSRTYGLLFESGFFFICLERAMKVSLAIVDETGKRRNPVYIYGTFGFCFAIILFRKYLERETARWMNDLSSIDQSSNNRTDENPNGENPNYENPIAENLVATCDTNDSGARDGLPTNQRALWEESWETDEQNWDSVPPLFYKHKSSDSGDTEDGVNEEEDEEVASVSKFEEEEVTTHSTKNNRFTEIASSVSELSTQAIVYKPFGTFLLFSDKGSAYVEDPESILELLVTMDSMNSPDQGMPGCDYGTVVENLSRKAICKDSTPGIGDITGYLPIQATIKKHFPGQRMRLNRAQIVMASLEWYMKASNGQGSSYYDSYKERRFAHDLDACMYKKQLTNYWKDMIGEAEMEIHSDFGKHWILHGTYYRLMIEPLDIAEYYKSGQRDYINQGRSKHYIKLQKWLEEEQSALVGLDSRKKHNVESILTMDSCFWAHIEEALLSCKVLASEEHSDPEEELAEKELIEFEDYIYGLLKDYAMSPEIFQAQSSYMDWWHEYKKIKGDSYNSTLTDFKSNPGNYDKYAKDAFVFPISPMRRKSSPPHKLLMIGRFIKDLVDTRAQVQAKGNDYFHSRLRDYIE